MKSKYKLYPISRYMLLKESKFNIINLYEMKEDCFYRNDENIVMTIKEDQCTRIIQKYGKSYYKIKV